MRPPTRRSSLCDVFSNFLRLGSFVCRRCTICAGSPSVTAYARLAAQCAGSCADVTQRVCDDADADRAECEDERTARSCRALEGRCHCATRSSRRCAATHRACRLVGFGDVVRLATPSDGYSPDRNGLDEKLAMREVALQEALRTEPPTPAPPSTTTTTTTTTTSATANESPTPAPAMRFRSKDRPADRLVGLSQGLCVDDIH